MSIAELFDNDFKLKMKGRFAAVACVLYADGKFDSDEKEFLDKLAKKLELSTEEYKEILNNPLKYELDPPYLLSERLESLYAISRVVHYDNQSREKQETLLRKFAVALGFSTTHVDHLVDKVLALVYRKVDLETFVKEMKNINP